MPITTDAKQVPLVVLRGATEQTSTGIIGAGIRKFDQGLQIEVLDQRPGHIPARSGLFASHLVFPISDLGFEAGIVEERPIVSVVELVLPGGRAQFLGMVSEINVFLNLLFFIVSSPFGNRTLPDHQYTTQDKEAPSKTSRIAYFG